jgi:hypothetical protein
MDFSRTFQIWSNEVWISGYWERKFESECVHRVNTFNYYCTFPLSRRLARYYFNIYSQMHELGAASTLKYLVIY